jgi:hypothetical protein
MDSISHYLPNLHQGILALLLATSMLNPSIVAVSLVNAFKCLFGFHVPVSLSLFLSLSLSLSLSLFLSLSLSLSLSLFLSLSLSLSLSLFLSLSLSLLTVFLRLLSSWNRSRFGFISHFSFDSHFDRPLSVLFRRQKFQIQMKTNEARKEEKINLTNCFLLSLVEPNSVTTSSSSCSRWTTSPSRENWRPRSPG